MSKQPVRSELTAEQKLWQENVEKQWILKKDAIDCKTKTEFSIRCGWSESAFGGYANGRTALNVNAIIIIAGKLGCSVTDIDPDFPIEQLDLQPDELSLLGQYRAASQTGKELMKNAGLLVQDTKQPKH